MQDYEWNEKLRKSRLKRYREDARESLLKSCGLRTRSPLLHRRAETYSTINKNCLRTVEDEILQECADLHIASRKERQKRRKDKHIAFGSFSQDSGFDGE
jgi:hypothetical protein